MVNIIHILVFMNCPERIILALKNKSNPSTLLITKAMDSPLSIAISRNFVECTNIILKYMSRRSIENPKCLSPLEHCLSQLNLIDLNYLPVLYSNLLRETKSSHLPKLCSSSVKLPILYKNKHMYVSSEHFFTDDQTNQQTQIKFYAAVVPLSYSIGSENSLALLKSLLNSPQEQIFASDFVETLLMLKWSQVK